MGQMFTIGWRQGRRGRPPLPPLTISLTVKYPFFDDFAEGSHTGEKYIVNDGFPFGKE